MIRARLSFTAVCDRAAARVDTKRFKILKSLSVLMVAAELRAEVKSDKHVRRLHSYDVQH